MEHRVHTGASVTILREDGRQFHFHLVPPMEANINRGKLSVATPLGKALLGRQPGEEFSYEVPSGEIHVKVLGVEPTAGQADSPTAAERTSPEGPAYRTPAAGDRLREADRPSAD